MKQDSIDGSKIIEVGESNGVLVYAHNNKNGAVYRLNGQYAEIINFLHSHKEANQKEIADGIDIDLKTCHKTLSVLLDLKIVSSYKSKNKYNQPVRIISLNSLFHFHGSNAIIVFSNFVSW